MRSDRLLKLADFLETKVDPKRFNLKYWATTDYMPQSCGTTACAMGWATVCFPRSGLKILQSTFSPTIDLIYKKHNGWEAVEEFMDLSEMEATWLFDEQAYPLTEPKTGPRAVAERIRQFVKARQLSKPKMTIREVSYENEFSGCLHSGSAVESLSGAC